MADATGGAGLRVLLLDERAQPAEGRRPQQRQAVLALQLVPVGRPVQVQRRASAR